MSDARNGRKLFGTDGVRGIANRYPMDGETAMRLGQAVALVLRDAPGLDHFVVGKDTRLSGYVLESALVAGICSMGMNVMLVGPLPTPGIAFIAGSMRAKGGVMVSASHNPVEYNGIKFFDEEGFKLPDDVELRIENLILSGKLDEQRVAPQNMGKAFRIDDASGRYIQYLKGTFPQHVALDGFKIVVDAANGAGYRVAPAVFRELGATVIPTCTSPNGLNINQHCGALFPERMARLVKEHGADLGVALDGDADRVILADEQGKVIDGDQILGICAKHLQGKGSLAKNTVVGTHMSNMGLELALKEMGIQFVRTDVGDRYVMEVMRREGYNLGGETSGHIIFLHHQTCGDGILAALRILSIMRQQERPLSQVATVFTSFPQVIQNIPVREKRPFDQIPAVSKAMNHVHTQLRGRGRQLVRYSGTENIARVMVEGEDPAMIEELARVVSQAIASEVGVDSRKVS
ncbi:MAG: phosphoglucosamine mutase [Deltaproteobacteria bacterium]|nr:phosphoglucosamine mutase [Deltaproteobacteria bacterium]